jgi:hypothetical protein
MTTQTIPTTCSNCGQPIKMHRAAQADICTAAILARRGGKPQQEEYGTRAEYRWARKQFNRKHGGSLFGTLAVAVFFGAITGSTALLFGLVASAVLVHLVARSRP